MCKCKDPQSQTPCGCTEKKIRYIVLGLAGLFTIGALYYFLRYRNLKAR